MSHATGVFDFPYKDAKKENHEADEQADVFVNERLADKNDEKSKRNFHKRQSQQEIPEWISHSAQGIPGDLGGKRADNDQHKRKREFSRQEEHVLVALLAQLLFDDRPIAKKSADGVSRHPPEQPAHREKKKGRPLSPHQNSRRDKQHAGEEEKQY